MANLVYKEIKTQRLLLRYPKKSDYEASFNFLKNKNNFPYADYKIAKTFKDIEENYDRMLLNHLNTSLYWTIALKSTDEPIGALSAWNVDFKNMTIEFGYSLYPNYRGNGYMKEAILATIDFLIKENNFYKFDIWTDYRNTNSIKLPVSLGFEFTGDVNEKAHHSDETITYKTYRLTINEE